MYETKTKPTKVTAATYIAKLQDEERRKDCKTLVSMMKRITGKSPKMWGPSIVGFDAYHYKYASGHEGDCCIVGFSSGKVDLTLYLMPGLLSGKTMTLINTLGKHKHGKACLYIRRLPDVNLTVLEKLIRHSVVEVKRIYPPVKKGQAAPTTPKM